MSIERGGKDGPGNHDDNPPGRENEPEEWFTVVVLPDTGLLADLNSEVYCAMTRWVVDNAETHKIAFCSHVGDLVEHPDNLREWELARRALSILDRRVALGISFGNHDISTDGKAVERRPFPLEHFPPSRFEGLPWYGGHEGLNSYQIISAAGMEFLFLHLECNPRDDVLAWADTVIDRHPSHRVVITAHHYLGRFEKHTPATGRRGRMVWSRFDDGNSPQQMWDKCFSKHRNLFLILCGDQGYVQAMRQTVQGHHGNTVYEVLSDYSYESSGVPSRDGYVRLLRFVPRQDRIEVRTYGTISGVFCSGTAIVPDRAEHQFELRYAMSRHVLS